MYTTWINTEIYLKCHEIGHFMKECIISFVQFQDVSNNFQCLFKEYTEIYLRSHEIAHFRNYELFVLYKITNFIFEYVFKWNIHWYEEKKVL